MQICDQFIIQMHEIIFYFTLQCHVALQGLVDPINNFAQYRQALEASISQADQAQERGWVVPFFSLIVKDIYFMHEGMTNRYVQSYTAVW